jgi:hypothetical protein
MFDVVVELAEDQGQGPVGVRCDVIFDLIGVALA